MLALDIRLHGFTLTQPYTVIDTDRQEILEQGQFSSIDNMASETIPIIEKYNLSKVQLIGTQFMTEQTGKDLTAFYLAKYDKRPIEIRVLGVK